MRIDPATSAVLRKQFVFIVGAPRSGTSWLHGMVSAHPDVASMRSELTLFSKYLAPADRFFGRESGHLQRGDREQGLPLLFTPEEFDQGLRVIVDRVYERVLARNPEASHILDKHPHYALHLPLIERLLPHARVLHIIRDGRDVAVSTMRTKRLIGHGQGDIEGASRVWHACITKAREHGRRMGPQRYLEVRYEELMADTTGGLKAVMAFCGLTVDDDRLRTIADEHAIERNMVSRGDPALQRRGDVPAWAGGLTLQERYLMDRYVGGLLADLGYGPQGWWKVKQDDGLRIALWRAKRWVKDLSCALYRAATRPLATPLSAVDGKDA
jgi:hypothetical protein